MMRFGCFKWPSGYLCAVREDYHDMLSEASKVTLRHQGGPMSLEALRMPEASSKWIENDSKIDENTT